MLFIIDKIPNGLVTLDMIDSEQSFQKFLGKSLNANGENILM